MFVDSHCHLSDASLVAQIDQILQQMYTTHVTRALCVSTSLPDFDTVLALAKQYPALWASVGVHPEEKQSAQLSKGDLIERAQHDKVIAIGETGLDYFQFSGCTYEQMQWQRERFATHIDAAVETGLPLIIHTRSAADDTLAQLKAAVNAPGSIKGVFHCFTESAEVARQVLDLGFYISFSGILTFKNAQYLREVACMVPHDACLIETDSPYLTPVPYRGKINTPAYVPHVAKVLSDLWQTRVEHVAQQTSQNFDTLFTKINA